MCIPTADNASGRQKDKAKCQVVLRQFLLPEREAKGRKICEPF